MRLEILDGGHTIRMKLLFAFIRAGSRLPVPDVIKLNRYRPEFYGMAMRRLTQEALRGPSAWSVGDRELMGAFVSRVNRCDVCTRTHAGVAALAYRDEAKVAAALENLEAAPIEEPLRATIRMLMKLTRDHTVTADDMRELFAAGVTRQQVEDALAVAFVFNVVDRLSRTFGWVVSGPRAFAAGARFLFRRGYA